MKKSSPSLLDLLMAKRELYMRFSKELLSSTPSTMTQIVLLGDLRKSWSGPATSSGSAAPMSTESALGSLDSTRPETMKEQREMPKTLEFTLTGCVDCGTVKAISKEEPLESQVAFIYGGSAVRMWKDQDHKHTLIVVRGKPERIFLSCQPYAKLLTEDGVAAICNFVEHIKPEQEVSNVPVS